MNAAVTTVTWRFMRENLADIINRVRYSNERIAITLHGKVVAEIAPPTATTEPESAGRLIARLRTPFAIESERS